MTVNESNLLSYIFHPSNQGKDLDEIVDNYLKKVNKMKSENSKKIKYPLTASKKGSSFTITLDEELFERLAGFSNVALRKASEQAGHIKSSVSEMLDELVETAREEKENREAFESLFRKDSVKRHKSGIRVVSVKMIPSLDFDEGSAIFNYTPSFSEDFIEFESIESEAVVKLLKSAFEKNNSFLEIDENTEPDFLVEKVTENPYFINFSKKRMSELSAEAEKKDFDFSKIDLNGSFMKVFESKLAFYELID